MTDIRGTRYIKKDLVKNKFALAFNKIKEFSLNVQSTQIPAVTIVPVKLENPFIDRLAPGTKPVYSDLSVTFVVDDVMNSYGMIYDWMRSFAPVDMTFDESLVPRKEFDSYRKDLQDVYDYAKEKSNGAIDYYDIATLLVSNSGGIPELEVRFFDIFPVSLTELPLDTRAESDELILCTATFNYWYYTIHRKSEI